MNVYERIKILCKSKGVSIAQMERDLGLAKSASLKWKTYTPNLATASKLAEYFGVTEQYIMTGKEFEGYYTSEEVAAIAQEVYERPEMKMLFDASKDVSKEDIEFVIQMVEKMKQK